MTFDPTIDRNYWRFSDSRRLIEAARDSKHELSIAMGERLDAWLDAAIELADAQDQLAVVRAERDQLLETVAQYEREDAWLDAVIELADAQYEREADQ